MSVEAYNQLQLVEIRDKATHPACNGLGDTTSILGFVTHQLHLKINFYSSQ